MHKLMRINASIGITEHSHGKTVNPVGEI